MEDKIRADDIQFPMLLNAMSKSSAMELNNMTPSQRTAFCTQVARTAKANKCVSD